MACSTGSVESHPKGEEYVHKHKSGSEETSHAVFKEQEAQTKMDSKFGIVENGTSCKFEHSSLAGEVTVLPSKDANKTNAYRKDASEEVNVVIFLVYLLFVEFSFHDL